MNGMGYELAFACFETLATMPVVMRAMIRAVPPWLTKRSGKPESGMMPIIAAMFMKDSVMIRIAMPATTKLPNISGALVLIRKALTAKST